MSAFDIHDSIAAIASPPGPAVRGVIRLSGPDILKSLMGCFDCPKLTEAIRGPVVLQGTIRVASPVNRVIADLFYWPGTASYTRQRSAEFHCTGSLPVLNEIMRTLFDLGVRQAQPGEFTMRAFLAGRIDLTRAEAVLGVIDSRSDREMQIALKQLAGGLAGPIESLQDQLVEMLAHIEAGLDFVEEDIEFVSRDSIRSLIDDSSRVLCKIIDQIDSRQLDQARPRVVITGLPNAGKSCLLNALSRTDNTGKSATRNTIIENPSAIVSNVAGTTRDYLVRSVLLDGLEIDLVDTAGVMFNETLDASSIQGQMENQTATIKSTADLQVTCIDGSQPLDEWSDARIDQDQRATERSVLVQTKCDQPTVWSSLNAIPISSVTGEGLAELRYQIRLRLQNLHPESAGELVGSTANRCFECLQNAARELGLAVEYCRIGQGDEMIAAVLRLVLDELAVVSGKVFTDDILDRVFSRFCIGK